MDKLLSVECEDQTSKGKKEHKENELRILQRKPFFYPRAEQCSVVAVRNSLEV